MEEFEKELIATGLQHMRDSTLVNLAKTLKQEYFERDFDEEIVLDSMILIVEELESRI